MSQRHSAQLVHSLAFFVFSIIPRASWTRAVTPGSEQYLAKVMYIRNAHIQSDFITYESFK